VYVVSACEETVIKSQAELDNLIRTAKGANAVEELARETRTAQVYQLSNGQTLSINKKTGVTKVQGKAH